MKKAGVALATTAVLICSNSLAFDALEAGKTVAKTAKGAWDKYSEARKIDERSLKIRYDKLTDSIYTRHNTVQNYVAYREAVMTTETQRFAWELSRCEYGKESAHCSKAKRFLYPLAGLIRVHRDPGEENKVEVELTNGGLFCSISDPSQIRYLSLVKKQFDETLRQIEQNRLDSKYDAPPLTVHYATSKEIGNLIIVANRNLNGQYGKGQYGEPKDIPYCDH